MRKSNDIAYKIINRSFDYTIDDKVEETKQIENSKLYCSKCGAEISKEDNFCKSCGNLINKSSNRQELEDLHSTFKIFVSLIVVTVVIAWLILLTPIEFDIDFLGFSVHPKLSYSILEQCMHIDIGAMSFKKENISITDYAGLKYKYLTNKKEFDELYRSFNKY